MCSKTAFKKHIELFRCFPMCPVHTSEMDCMLGLFFSMQLKSVSCVVVNSVYKISIEKVRGCASAHMVDYGCAFIFKHRTISVRQASVNWPRLDWWLGLVLTVISSALEAARCCQSFLLCEVTAILLSQAREQCHQMSCGWPHS